MSAFVSQRPGRFVPAFEGRSAREQLPFAKAAWPIWRPARVGSPR